MRRKKLFGSRLEAEETRRMAAQGYAAADARKAAKDAAEVAEKARKSRGLPMPKGVAEAIAYLKDSEQLSDEEYAALVDKYPHVDKDALQD